MKKTWTFDENEIIATAKALGIKLSNAELGSVICEAWADRVRRAKACLTRAAWMSASAPSKTPTLTRLEARHERLAANFGRRS